MERSDEAGDTQESSRRRAWPLRQVRAQRQARAHCENGRKGGLVKSRAKTRAARRDARRPRAGRRKKLSVQ